MIIPESKVLSCYLGEREMLLLLSSICYRSSALLNSRRDEAVGVSSNEYSSNRLQEDWGVWISALDDPYLVSHHVVCGGATAVVCAAQCPNAGLSSWE